MRKFLLALSAVLVMSSFTQNPTTKTILKDIDGTLLQSFPVIEKNNDKYTVTFTVDAMTVVTTTTDENGTHVNLIENGNSNATVTHTFVYGKGNLDFNSYLDTNYDVASSESMNARRVIKGKPILIGGDDPTNTF